MEREQVLANPFSLDLAALFNQLVSAD